MRKIIWKEMKWRDRSEPYSIDAKVGFVKLSCRRYNKYPIYSDTGNEIYKWISFVVIGDLHPIHRVGKAYKTIDECKEAAIRLAQEFLLDFHDSIGVAMECFDDVVDAVGSTNVRILGKTCKHDPSFV